MLAFDDAIFPSDTDTSYDASKALRVKLERILKAYELTLGKDIISEIAGGKKLSIEISPHEDFIEIRTELVSDDERKGA